MDSMAVLHATNTSVLQVWRQCGGKAFNSTDAKQTFPRFSSF